MAGIWHTYLAYKSKTADTSTATFNYAVYGTVPDDFDSSGIRYKYTGNVSYEWHYPGTDWYGESGSIELTGFSSGTKYNDISATVTMFCEREIYTWNDDSEGFDNFFGSEWSNEGSATASLSNTFYTKQMISITI